MRTTLLPPLLAAVRRNIGRGQRDLALFEIGRVFHPAERTGNPPPILPVDRRPADEDLALAETIVPGQPWHVAAVYCGEIEPAGWYGAGRMASWADAVEAATDRRVSGWSPREGRAGDARAVASWSLRRDRGRRHGCRLCRRTPPGRVCRLRPAA